MQTATLNTTNTQNAAAAPRRRTFRRIRRILLALFILIIGLIVLGIGYQSITTAYVEASFPAPGQHFIVNGRAIHIHCVGQGDPTVILDAGAYGFSGEWYWVQHQLASTNRVCAYDRPGMGWSEPALTATPRTLLNGVEELHALLKAANIPAPYVLVGHSYGAIRIRVFASQYPDDVLGLVLVDSAINTLNFKNVDEYQQYKRDNDLLNAPVWLMVRMGIARLSFPDTYRAYGYPPEVADLIAAKRSSNQVFDAYYAEGIAAMYENSQQSEAAESLGDLPVQILWATVLPRQFPAEEMARYTAYQEEIAGFSTRGETHFVSGADHGSILGDETYAGEVSRAVLAVIKAASQSK